MKKSTFEIEQQLFLSFKSWTILKQKSMQDFFSGKIDEVLEKGEISEKDKIKKIIYSGDDITFKKTFEIASEKLPLFKSILSRNNIKMKDFLIYQIELELEKQSKTTTPKYSQL